MPTFYDVFTPAPEAVIELFRCNCAKNRCSTSRCNCRKTQLNCTDLCGCSNSDDEFGNQGEDETQRTKQMKAISRLELD